MNGDRAMLTRRALLGSAGGLLAAAGSGALALTALPAAIDRWRAPSSLTPGPRDTAAIINRLLAREGGFADHPADRGGPTNFGITQPTLGRWRGRPASRADVAALTVAEARAIYRTWYVEKPGFERIADPALREQLIDAGVLSGPGTAIGWLQTALKTRPDGILGPRTLRLLARADGAAIRREFCKRRVLGLVRIAAADPSQLPFAAGWVGRALEFLG